MNGLPAQEHLPHLLRRVDDHVDRYPPIGEEALNLDPAIERPPLVVLDDE